MNSLETFLENTWNGILSRDSKRIQDTYLGLDSQNQHVVLEHLKKMASETDWHHEQIKSAQIALKAITELKTQ